MHASDVTVVHASVRHTPITLSTPFRISGRVIDWFTLAEVTVGVRSRDGAEAEGTGATVLSVPWAWPRDDVGPNVDVVERDRLLRELTEHFARSVVGGAPGDPIRLWRGAYETVDEARRSARSGVEIPRLAALLALGAVDSAVHDAWARAAGAPAHLLYDADHLDADLGFLGSELTGAYPGDFLVPPRATVEVQHVVGVGDPLTPDDAGPGQRCLVDWLREDRPRHLKIKTAGSDTDTDVRRVLDIAELADRADVRPSLSVDPNEGYRTARQVGDFLAGIGELAEEVTYLEQPWPREIDIDGANAVSEQVPVLLDEGFTRLDQLSGLQRDGWSGVVIKAAKGQTPALLTHAYAVANGLSVAVQDLTAVDTAFLHSARLVSLFDLTFSHLEYNSRQYAPAGNDDLAITHPRLVRVDDGVVVVPEPRPGLY